MNNLNILESLSYDSYDIQKNTKQVIDKTKDNIIGFVGIKWVGMIYVAIIQIISCLILSKLISSVIPPIKKKDENKKPLDSNDTTNFNEPLRLTFIYSFVNLALILLGVYIMRNITQHIPFPFDGVAGYEHSRLREINGVFIANFVLLYYQTKFLDRLKIIFNKFL